MREHVSDRVGEEISQGEGTTDRDGANRRREAAEAMLLSALIALVRDQRGLERHARLSRW